MALTAKARATFAVMRALTAVGLAPTAEKAVKMPLDKRIGSAPARALLGPVRPAVTTDVAIPTRDGASLRARTYEPERRTPVGTVVYFHGGGFALGGLASCDHICRRIVDDTGVGLVSVEYRLAPEHPFPTPLHDAADAVAWARSSGICGGDPVVVAGDSAGGNLAAAVTLLLHDEGEPVAGQMLIYPAVDLSPSAGSPCRWIGLSARDLEVCSRTYLGDHDPRDPLASPAFAPDLGILPPTLVVTVEHDPLREQGRDFAERCKAAGVDVRYLDVADHAHGSLSVPRLYRRIDDIYAAIAEFLRTAVPLPD